MADISIWQKTGHFYFALTVDVYGSAQRRDSFPFYLLISMHLSFLPAVIFSRQGRKVGVPGTPGFFENGVFLSGALPPADFERIIDSQLALPGAPTRRSDCWRAVGATAMLKTIAPAEALADSDRR